MKIPYNILEQEILNQKPADKYSDVNLLIFILCDLSSLIDIDASKLCYSLNTQSYQNYQIKPISNINDIYKTLNKLSPDYFMILKPEFSLAPHALSQLTLSISKNKPDIIFANEYYGDFLSESFSGEVFISKSNFSKNKLINNNFFGYCFAIKSDFFVRNHAVLPSDISHPATLVSSLSVFTENIFFLNKVLLCLGDSFKWTYNKNNSLRKNCKNLLFISHESTQTGAPVALLAVIQALVKLDFSIFVISYQDGKLTNEFSSSGITTLLTDDNMNTVESLPNIIKDFDLVLVNTAKPCETIDKLLNTNVPVLWWIHESFQFFEYIKPKLPLTLSDNINIYNISTRSQTAMKKTKDNYLSKGIFKPIFNDFSENFTLDSNITSVIDKNKISFLCIGTVYPIKGQDILCKAILSLDKSYQEKCQFIFVGEKYDDEIFNNINSLLKTLPDNTTYINSLPRQQLFSLISDCDCLIVPSRDDSLPNVAIEAMIFSTPVICSENAGISSLLSDGISGFVYCNNDIDNLKDKIIYAVDNSDCLPDIGKNARVIYENNFTKQAFKNNSVPIILDLIK
ncbi:MAG: glycosyltransferase family 4 protein [Clostridia bacterium]|nr:glycosyltransferase family 4 protein [Clostridia bacterium]